MKKCIVICAFFLFGFSSHLYAAAGWSGEATVTSIYAISENSAVIKLSFFNNPNSCDVSSAGDVWINPSVQKTWFTMLLTAYATGRKVNIYVSASCDTTHWANQSFGQIHHVRLVQ